MNEVKVTVVVELKLSFRTLVLLWLVPASMRQYFLERVVPMIEAVASEAKHADT